MSRSFICDDSTTVKSEQGLLRGYQVDGTYVFKGIPYAKADRFQMPREVEPSDDVFDATSFGYVCPLLKQEAPRGELLVPHRYWLYDENCQNLNIWTQTLDSQAKKPVLVWLHGGGFAAGSAIEQISYEGENLSKHGDVVVVSVNHRLNILGYLDLSPFGEKYKNSGNAGNADLVASLKWIQKNIAAFGGDPGNITIFGQSGGGIKVSSLMQTPDADGLFHKGIIMSGVIGGDFFGVQGDGTHIMKAILKEIGLKEDEVEKLETLPYQVIADAYNKASPKVREEGHYTGGYPQINDYYKGELHLQGITEHAKTIPVIVGTVFGEFAFGSTGLNKFNMSETEKESEIRKRFGEAADQLIPLFRAAYPEKSLIDLISLDVFFRQPTRDFVRAKARYQESPVYEYLFALDFPYDYGKPAWHCSDIPFFFHNTEYLPICHFTEAAKLEDQIFAAVMSFVRTGNPNHKGLPNWPACTPDDEATMIFNTECSVRHNFDGELLKAFEEPAKKALMAIMGHVSH